MFRIFIVLFSVLICYLNFMIFQSYKVQTGVTSDFNYQEYKEENFVKLKNTNINFPNLSGTGFPMYALLANYNIRYGDLNNALEILNTSTPSNPYLMVRESLKAEVFFRLGIRDSSYYYSKIAYNNLPKNARHFQQYITELTWRKDLEEINNVFLNNRSKSDPQIWLNYFSGVINLKKKNDLLIDSLANVALIKFPKNDKIKAISAYILYGVDNVKKSYDLFEEGTKSFNDSKYKIAAEKFKEAVELNPIDYSFKENAGMSLINTGNYREALVYLEQAMNSIDKLDDGKTEYCLGMCYKELDEKTKSCEFLKKAMELNYIPAFNYFSQNCK